MRYRVINSHYQNHQCSQKNCWLIRYTDLNPSVWLSRLSKSLPNSIQLDGFDVSDDQYLPERSLSSNIKLRTLDALKPVPRNLVGQYDVVHIGLFSLVLRSKSDFEALLKHVIDLLGRSRRFITLDILHPMVVTFLTYLVAPGGWLQWDELDLPGTKAVVPEPHPPSSSAEEAVVHFHDRCRTVGFYWE